MWVGHITPHLANREFGAYQEVSMNKTNSTYRDTDAADKAANTPSPLSLGSDDIMSQQQQQSMPSLPSADELKGKWKQQVGAAKIAWGKLTEDELLRLEGHEQKLAGLVQERYAITRDEADKQVKSFFDKFKS